MLQLLHRLPLLQVLESLNSLRHKQLKASQSVAGTGEARIEVQKNEDKGDSGGDSGGDASHAASV